MKNNFVKALMLLIVSSLIFLVLKAWLPKTIFTETTNTVDKNIVQDTLMLQVIKKAEEQQKKETQQTEPIKAPKINISDYQSRFYMNTFYEKLLRLKNGEKENIRIAYYGDSMNDADLIVQHVRKLFQENYGGKGVGFVNIYSESGKTRGSIKHTFAPKWHYNYFLKFDKKFPLGVSGYVAHAKDTTGKYDWVKYSASVFIQKNYLNKPTLFYGKPDSSAFVITTINKKIDTIFLKGKSRLNTLKISNGVLSNLKLHFVSGNTPLYGINFDNGKGVHVDNFSTRGNSGLPLSLLRAGLMNSFQKKFDYDLIILQYGTNIISKRKHYGWYGKAMTKVVQHLQKAFPKADILILSVADKSRKYETEMMTDSAVYKMLNVQNKLAIDQQLSFVSLYKLMGGNNAMIKWVTEKPYLANKDYTHFNIKGSEKIAKLIYNEIEKGFTDYQNKHRKKNEQIHE